jgi:hypothetical protein
LPGISGVTGWVSNSDIQPPRDQPQGGLDAGKARADDEADTIHILKRILDAEDAKRAVQTWGSVKSLQDQRCDGEGRISDERFLQDFEVLTSQTLQLLVPLELRKTYSARSDESGPTIFEGGL